MGAGEYAELARCTAASVVVSPVVSVDAAAGSKRRRRAADASHALLLATASALRPNLAPTPAPPTPPASHSSESPRGNGAAAPWMTRLFGAIPVTPDTTTTLHSTRKAVAVPELSGTQTQPHWRTYVRKKLTAISVLIGRLLLVRHRARRDRGRAHGCTRAAHGAYSGRRLELGSSLAGWLARSLAQLGATARTEGATIDWQARDGGRMRLASRDTLAHTSRHHHVLVDVRRAKRQSWIQTVLLSEWLNECRQLYHCHTRRSCIGVLDRAGRCQCRR